VKLPASRGQAVRGDPAEVPGRRARAGCRQPRCVQRRRRRPADLEQAQGRRVPDARAHPRPACARL